MKKEKFAIIGWGHIGRKHAEVILSHPGTELAAIVEPSGAFSDSQPAIKKVPVFKSLDALLESNKDFDIASICSPNHLHCQQALRVLDSKKHVLIEKPMGLTKAECEKVLHKGLNVSRQIFCVMQNRYALPIQWLKKLVDSDALGSVFMVQVNCFWNRDDRYYFPGGSHHPWHGKGALDGGPLFTQFSHFIDLVYWLFGDWTKIQATFSNFAHQHSTEFEDSGVVNFQLENGAIGNLTYSTAVWNTNFESTITIVGEKGTIKIGGQYMDKLEYCNMDGLGKPDFPGLLSDEDTSSSNHHKVIQNVIDVLQGQKEISTNALEGMKTVEIIEKIYQQR